MNDLFVYDRYKTVSEAEVAAEQLLALGDTTSDCLGG